MWCGGWSQSRWRSRPTAGPEWFSPPRPKHSGGYTLQCLWCHGIGQVGGSPQGVRPDRDAIAVMVLHPAPLFFGASLLLRELCCTAVRRSAYSPRHQKPHQRPNTEYPLLEGLSRYSSPLCNLRPGFRFNV